MTWYRIWGHILVTYLCAYQVRAGASVFAAMNALVQAQGTIMTDHQLPGLLGPVVGFPGNQLPILPGPADIPMFNVSPPIAPTNYLTLPQFPIGMVDFQLNHSQHKITTAKDRVGHLSVPPGAPVDFLKVPNWKKYFQVPPGLVPNGPMPVSPKDYALGLVVQGTVIEGKATGPQVDPIHHLPINHLFVPVPITRIRSQKGYAGKRQPAPPPPPTVADILIVIDASESMGVIDAGGRVVWNPAIVDFLNKFIRLTPMGPDANRIGVVVVSVGIDDMIPITNDRKLLIESLNLLRPSFRGGCTEKGISTASSLFYQYGRPIAVKRIVLLTEGTGKCPYRNMAEIMYARKCGIDIIHVGFGPMPNPIAEEGYQSLWMVPGPDKLVTVAEPVAKRAYINPIHGAWSQWSDWNICSATGTCTIGYRMRFRVCDNPKPAYGGQICHGFAAETRMCHMRPCIDNSLVGHWTRWGDFTPCSSPCGIGSMTRSRSCITLGGNPSAACPGKYVEVKECIVKNCPVDGRWSHWSAWGLCSQICGIGIKIRARQCDNPVPKDGGKFCHGIAVEESVCDTAIMCPIHGGFGPWKQSDKCDAQCGIGKLKLIRECDDPIPQFGGMMCIGETVRFEPCDTGIPCPVPGKWGVWTLYTACSVKCGIGYRSRQRFCDSPEPKYNGPNCEGPPIEEQNCDTGIFCPVEGQWSAWTDFAPCSAICGVGQTRKFRLCNNPVPVHGGRDCIGLPVDVQDCDTGKVCPIDGEWSKWTRYSACSVKCGRGIQGRIRDCSNPAPQYGGSLCVGLDREEKECDTGVSCPVHGYWSPWLPWSPCSAPCELGFRQRHRLCNNPSPRFGGLECTGSPIEDDVCDTRIPCPVNGGWSEWSAPLPCSVDCGVGTTKRLRECNSPLPMHGGDDCAGHSSEVIECTTGIECPVNGRWSFWSKWSICDVKCGTSMQSRVRTCDNPPPMFEGLPCNGPPIKKRICDTGIKCPIDGRWGLWTKWTECSEYCGVGISFRKRLCDSPYAQYGGIICQGNDYEETACDTGVPCPIDGGWSLWSDLSACSVTCDIGAMRRSRVCNNPPPQFNGVPCFGPNTEEMPCNTAIECPVHGNWGLWTDYTLCNVKCGSGMKSRTRDCNSPIPLFGGDVCTGPDIENIPCETGVFCPVHGEWGLWTAFSPCKKDCGVSLIQRTRMCDNPTPMYGGIECVGVGIEDQICDTGVQCPIDGHWGLWKAYSICSVTCGVGVQQRHRQCNDPPPLYGGGDCAGTPLETRECDTGIFCPVNGGWTLWAVFGPCNVDCGIGMQQRERACSNPVPAYGGHECVGDIYHQRSCNTGIHCAIGGGWSPWASWTSCSVDCGTGSSFRTRECSNPPPMYGGSHCKGPSDDKTVCNTGINCPIHGGWSLWGEYYPCSVSCGSGIMQRMRICDSPMPQYGGQMCIGDKTDGAVCNTDIMCPIDGGFSGWSDWSPCSANCGEGMQFRTRLCNSPVAMYGGVSCKGFFRDERICDTGVYCPIDGNWGLWAPFSGCSVECGSGIKKRSRLCDSPRPMYGGRLCHGTDLDKIACDTGINCPIHGDWIMWTPWTGCSVNCGVGAQQRKRSCTNPEPLWGGMQCKGNPLQEQVCNTGVSCPINGMWSFWSNWLPCSAPCNAGTQSRVRVCDNPLPQFGGQPCVGDKAENIVCDTGIPCPIDGKWTPWTLWSECTVTCGLGLQQRVRTCSDPPPKYGGNVCPGNADQVRECDTSIFCPIDGQWALWTKWTHCSSSCSVGIHMRTRTCTNPLPDYGGKYCAGPQDEKGQCDTGIPCPIDGNWGPWTGFGSCNMECGIGMQTRTRKCNNPHPQFGGGICFGGNSEDITCDTGTMCPVNGRWTDWSPFGQCSSDCGIGEQHRTRSCTNPPAEFGGLPCKGLDVNILKCDSGVHCPINGGWAHWYEWSPCYGDCGIGKRERRRVCNDPRPMFGGLPCKGPHKLSGDCNTGVHCPVAGGWSNWSPPSPCSVVCGIGTLSRFRECTNPPPQYGGPDCVGPREDIGDCDTLIPCPIDGSWGAWSGYGRCNTKCGVGLHARKRVCDLPSPQYGGRDCVGISIEETKCDTNVPCVIHGGWSFWSPWSTCQTTCGKGQQMRVRVCNNPSPLYGGYMCKGPDTDVMPCDTGVYCPIDGGWTPWSDWDMCSEPCGTGLHSRHRTCTAPAPQFGGAVCRGPVSDTQDCITGIPCPIDGLWAQWTLWTGCSQTCDVGVRTRERVCDDPPPQFGGAPCTGVAQDVQKCVTGVPCPVHGTWSHWTTWSVCMADCALGKQIRTRICNSPAPLYGGLICAGPSEQMKNCDTGKHCPIDGNWGSWIKWTVCSAKCGIGERRRLRECNNPREQFGGIPCKGFAEELDACDSMVQCPRDGNWSPWSRFVECSATCNMGMQTRQRVCNDPPPLYGGLNCDGFAEETISCDTGVHCQINGNWGRWYAWSTCSVTCGTGEMERHRDCNNPIQQYGGLPCQGPSYEIGPCDTKTLCPINGNWGHWSPYTSCAGKCGLGSHERFRVCNNPSPQFGGETCIGNDLQTAECDTGRPCAINGNWGMWLQWGVCSVQCGIGIHSRVRECNSPPPQFGGLDCPGPDIVKQKCDTLQPCAVHGGWSYWSSWSECSANCEMGTKFRFRQCTNPTPLHGGFICNGPDKERIECDSGVPCPIDGQWGGWYKWSRCSVKCGTGLQERSRGCNAPSPQYGGLPCKGPKTEVLDCATGVTCPIDGHWTLWTPWGQCSKTCDTGLQSRTRICDNPAPAFGGIKCRGFSEELRQCDSGIPCVIHGNWGMWTGFTECSATCGIGMKKRVRICDNPPPKYGGTDCVGQPVEHVKCDSMIPCPEHGSWTLWAPWTACDANCGVGIRERWRLCTNPVPKHGGQPCNGPDLEIVDCDTKTPCAVDGQWSLWSHWDMCSVTCGRGRQFRFRTCSNPRPVYGGKLCAGLPEEVKECNTGNKCSIHGQWAHWSHWHMCDANCGRGNQIRVRTCTAPKPLYGGKICFGIPQEKRQCDSGLPCPRNGNWSAWSNWEVCDAPCGFGYQNRSRTCTNPSPLFGGMVCLGIPNEHRRCDSGQPCPIDGQWGAWAGWNDCDVTCGMGRRKRLRQCNSPAPQNGGKYCIGGVFDDEKCDTGVQCRRPGGWSLWALWSACTVKCGLGYQFRKRFCNNPPPIGPGMGCRGYNEERTQCDTGILCPVNGGWTEWSQFGKCTADCQQGPANAIGYKIRRRYCENPAPANGGLPCRGNSGERARCNNFPPCFIPEWGTWTKWTKCSEECGPGQQERTRECAVNTLGRPSNTCSGVGRDVLPCKVLNCPTTILNCSTECKWDNGIGYATYPGDCTMFVQCDTLDGIPVVQDCAFGLLWSLNILQCVYPAQSECDICARTPGRLRTYHISCRAYWDCRHGAPVAKCCAKNERFNAFTHQCELDKRGLCNQPCPPVDIIPVAECIFRESSLGSTWYEQEVNRIWVPRPCGAGTVFSPKECQCIYYTDGFSAPKKECKPDLHVMFDTLQQDLDRNTGLHVVNVKYNGDGTAYFDGTAAINDNIFSNAEWGQDVYVYIRFKPEGQGHNQGLVHNSGCGPSDIGPSVFIGMDREQNQYGPDMINMKFATVPKKAALEYDFVNITTPANKMIDAWFKFGKGQFIAEVDGLVATLDITGASHIARRHGAINIGGNLCKIGNESFGGFVGTLDEVRIYKCKPAHHLKR